jgi:hypothetical protein
LGILRYVRFIEVGDWIVDPQFLLPFAKQKMNGADDISGVGDLIVGGIAWPLHDAEKGRYFGFGGF